MGPRFIRIHAQRFLDGIRPEQRAYYHPNLSRHTFTPVGFSLNEMLMSHPIQVLTRVNLPNLVQNVLHVINIIIFIIVVSLLLLYVLCCLSSLHDQRCCDIVDQVGEILQTFSATMNKMLAMHTSDSQPFFLYFTLFYYQRSDRVKTCCI